MTPLNFYGLAIRNYLRLTKHKFGCPLLSRGKEHTQTFGEAKESEDVATLPQAQSGTKTLDIAAQAVGMKRETYRQGSRSVLAPSTVPSGRDKD
jgi:hypothetical protein